MLNYSEHAEVNVIKYMLCLSKSTMIRRRSNIMSLIKLCMNQNQNNHSGLLKKIYFEL